MKFVRRIAKYRWQDYKTNEDILTQLMINPVVKNIQNYKHEWVQRYYEIPIAILTDASQILDPI